MTAQILVDEDGTRTVQLSNRDGLVVMHFEKPVRWCALDAATASRFAEACARAAYTTVSGDTPTTQARSQITEQIRVRLTKRVELMLRSFEGEAPRADLSVQASRLVDACMKETA